MLLDPKQVHPYLSEGKPADDLVELKALIAVDRSGDGSGEHAGLYLEVGGSALHGADEGKGDRLEA